MIAKLIILTVLMSTTTTVAAAAVTSEDMQANNFCEKFPTLHMCRLRDELTGSLVELQYLLHDGGEAAGLQAIPQQEVQKRKSAFVRFGKRSSDDSAAAPAPGAEDDDSMEMEKRKSAFVRFGRAAGAEKRKSQYIRFGK